jgi:ATP-dependent DNA ligase
MNIIDYIEQIKEAQGTNAKLDILRDYSKDDIFKQVLFYAYNPFYNYYIRKIPKVKSGAWSTIGTFEAMFELLDDLRNRKVTGNLAIEQVSNFIQHAPAQISKVLILVLNRDLKMGINTTSINKICPDLIPTFDVMLADAGIPLDQVLKDNEWVYVQKKSDGKRCIAICKNDSVEFYARSGKEIENLSRHKLLKNSILTIRNYCVNEDFILDGEIIIENEDGSDADRQYSNGLIMKKNLPEHEVERFSFIVWDMVSLEDFQNNSNDVTYENRYYKLINNINNFKNLKVIETYVATTAEGAVQITNDFIERGFEGSIVKTPYHTYKRKRSKDWIKFKDVKEADLKVVGYKYGKPGSKYETMLGALSCESEDGLLKVDVGSGYSDELRKSIKASDVNDTIITVKYNQIIKNADGNHSLYLPIFSEFRTDKSVADTLDKIKKNG